MPCNIQYYVGTDAEKLRHLSEMKALARATTKWHLASQRITIPQSTIHMYILVYESMTWFFFASCDPIVYIAASGFSHTIYTFETVLHIHLQLNVVNFSIINLTSCSRKSAQYH